jgi:hypothetical protein
MIVFVLYVDIVEHVNEKCHVVTLRVNLVGHQCNIG